jgi:hypothetical protein
MKVTLDIKMELGKASIGSRKLFKFLVDRYFRDGESLFNVDDEVPGLESQEASEAMEELIRRGFAFRVAAQPGVIKLNRTRLDSIRPKGTNATQ